MRAIVAHRGTIMSQFPKVSSQYGAPMGRREHGALSTEPRSINLFRVRINAGGYDDGGAYWGTGLPLYCAQDDEGQQQFTRASSRGVAAVILNIYAPQLKKPADGAMQYACALIDGRAPMPAGASRASIVEWMKQSGARMGQAS